MTKPEVSDRKISIRSGKAKEIFTSRIMSCFQDRKQFLAHKRYIIDKFLRVNGRMIAVICIENL